MSAFSQQPQPEERNLLSPPQMPQRAESMPNVHEVSTEPERPRSSINVRAALSNLALMRQGRDPTRNRMPTPNGGPLRGNGSYSRGHSPIAPSAAHIAARLVTSGSPSAAGSCGNDGLVGGGPIIGGASFSRSQHNLLQCGSMGRSSTLHNARVDCQPYLLSPPSHDSHWRRTNSDSALHQSAIQAEQQQQQQQQGENWPAYHQPPAPPYSPPTYINGSSTNDLNGSITAAFGERSQYSEQVANMLQSQPLPIGGAGSSPSAQLNRPTPVSAGPIAFSNFSATAHQQLQQNVRQVAANVNRAAAVGAVAASPHSGNNLLSNVHSSGGLANASDGILNNSFGGGNTAHVLSAQLNLVASNECLTQIGCSSPGAFCSGSVAIKTGPGGAFGPGAAIGASGNGLLMANGLSSRFGGSHGVGLDLLGTSHHHGMQHFGQQMQQQFSHATSPHQHFQQQSQTFGSFPHQQQHERPRSCDLPQVYHRSQPNSAMSSQVGSQLSSPLSMQQSPLHSPPSYSSGLQSPGNGDFQQQKSTQSATASNVSEMLYQMPLTSPPAYPGSARQNGPNSVGSNDRPDSATLSSAGSPPQSLPPPQSPQSQPLPSVSGRQSTSVQVCPPSSSADQHHQQIGSTQSPAEQAPDSDPASFPLDLDGLDECFESLEDDPDASNSFVPSSSQSPSHQTNSLSMSNSDLVRPFLSHFWWVISRKQSMRLRFKTAILLSFLKGSFLTRSCCLETV